jgi:protein ImuB
VFAQPTPVVVLGEGGGEIEVNERGMLLGHPVWFSPTGARADATRVTAWAGPWPVRERWWDAGAATSVNRFQVVDGSGSAWLLVLEGRNWVAEGRYD